MDKMREEFESWCKGIGLTLKPNAFGNGYYAIGYGWEEWNAWEASRAALRVELPDVSKYEDGGEWGAGYSCAVSDLKDGLNQIGVTCK